MWKIVRTTQNIDNGQTSKAFSHVWPLMLPEDVDISTADKREEVLERLIASKVLVTDTNTYDDYAPVGSGEYEFTLVENPRTERKWCINVEEIYDDYYNDEYTASGIVDFFLTPTENREDAIKSGNEWIESQNDRVAQQYANHDWSNNLEFYNEPSDGIGYKLTLCQLDVVIPAIE